MPLVLRRLGYILGLLFIALGLLFIAAFLLAIPLTWGRRTIVKYGDGGFHFSASAETGQAAVEWVSTSLWSFPYGLTTDRQAWKRPSHVAGLYRFETRPSPFGRGRRVMFPLWAPAVAVGVPMLWRWRLSRRRQAAGFPMDQRPDQPDTSST